LGGITVASEAVTLNGTGVSSAGALRNFSGDNTLASAVTLASASRINSDAGTLTLSGGITGSDLGITFGGAGNVTVSATGLTLGTGTLTKDGAGTLLLSVANTYSGATTISGGTLKVGIAGALGTGAVSVAAGGTLDLNSQSITNPITLATGATLTGGSLPATSVPTTGVLDVVLTGSATLAKTDAGTLTLVAANTFTGATTATAGKIAIADFGNGTDPSPLGVTSLSDPTKLILGNGATLEFTGTTATTTSRSFTVNGAAALAVDAAAAPLTFSSSSIMALDPADPTPDLKLTAFNSGVNRFEAQLSADDLANNRGLANLAIDGTGKWVLAGSANRFKGDVRVDIGGGATLGFESGSLGLGATYASSDIVVANGSRLAWSGTNTDDISSRLSVPTSATVKLDLGSNNVTFAGLQNVSGGATIQKEGTGTLNITSAVSAPEVNLTVPANSGLLAINGTVGNVTLSSGSRLGGTGTVGIATVGAGAFLAPGNSPGTLNATTLVLGPGSTFDWEVQNATDLTNGFDKIVLSGNLDLSGGAPGQKVTFRIISRLGSGDGNQSGNPLNFDPPGVAAQPTVFQFGTVGGLSLNAGTTNISDVFQFDLSQFTYSDGSSSNAGLWSIDYSAGVVTLTAVPEPSTYGFAMGALALAAAAIRRRKRQATKA
jgi:autotransporter-associated beta strand protein